MLDVIVVIAAIQLVLIVSILFAALVARLCRMRVSRVSVGLGTSTVLIAIGLARGWPRIWVLLVNVLLLNLWGSLVNAGMGNELAANLSGFGLTLVMLPILALPSVRRWFHQECPACHTLGARPVWSRRRAFGCIRCGSCWTE